MNKKALFLDRDGIINVDKGYVYNPDDIEFIAPIFDVIRFFHNAGYMPVVVTNQSGIGRGFYSEDQFAYLCDWMQKRFCEQGLPPIPFYYCPHHPTEAHPAYRKTCECRKPRPGMLLRAAEELALDLTESVMIGDSWRDIQAAANAGVSTCFFVSSAKAGKIDDTVNVYQVTDIATLYRHLSHD